MVRGPATLLYGANAIGGLVNVISNDIPRAPVTGASGTVTLDAGSAASEGGAAADLTVGRGAFAFHAGGSGRRAGDVRTPLGASITRNPALRSGMSGPPGQEPAVTPVRATASTTRDTGFRLSRKATSNSRLAARPSTSATEVPRLQGRSSVRSGRRPLSGATSTMSWKAEKSARRSRTTRRKPSVAESSPVRAASRHDGGWGLTRSFEAAGAEALSPPVDQQAGAASSSRS